MTRLIPAITIPHRVDFGADRDRVGDTLLRPESWDRLRLDTTGPFSLAATPDALDALARAHPEIGDRMRLLDAHLHARSARTVVSYGVGAAVPEAWLRTLRPDRELVLTDYAPGTVARLRELMPGARIEAHDLIHDAPLDGDVHLFHRIDTEFSNAQWHEIFARFADRHVVLVATELLGLSRLRHEARSIVVRAPRASAGWVRNRRAFESLWQATHVQEPLVLGDLQAWTLRPRDPSA